MIRIDTPRLLLRDFNLDDFDALREIESDAEVLRYRSRHVISAEETRAFLEEYTRAESDPHRSRLVLAVIRREDARLVAQVGLNMGGIWLEDARLFYSTNRLYWGQGYASEAVAGLVKYAFDTLARKQVSATCHPQNTASWRVMEKVGMTRSDAGERLWVKDAWWDMLLYTLTREAWLQHTDNKSHS